MLKVKAVLFCLNQTKAVSAQGLSPTKWEVPANNMHQATYLRQIISFLLFTVEFSVKSFR